MSQTREEMKVLAGEIDQCRRILSAIGDENRQHLVLEMLEIGNVNGMRVGEIVEKTHLSRPAVSHHLKVLKDVGIVRMRREGTKNFYYFDSHTDAMKQLIDMLEHAKKLMEYLQSKNEEAKWLENAERS